MQLKQLAEDLGKKVCVFYDRRQYKNALDCLKQLMAVEIITPVHLQWQAKLNFQLGKREKALLILDAGVTAGLADTNTYILKADLLCRMGQIEDCLRYCNFLINEADGLPGIMRNDYFRYYISIIKSDAVTVLARNGDLVTFVKLKKEGILDDVDSVRFSINN